MKRLFITATKTTPEVDFNPENGQLKISGESFPENSADFYAPIIAWLQNYISRNPSISLTFKMIYFNTSSSKAILDIIALLQDYHNKGGVAEINWMYQEDDEDIMET